MQGFITRAVTLTPVEHDIDRGGSWSRQMFSSLISVTITVCVPVKSTPKACITAVNIKVPAGRSEAGIDSSFDSSS